MSIYWVALLSLIVFLSSWVVRLRRRLRFDDRGAIARKHTEFRSLIDAHEVFDNVIAEFSKTPGTKEIKVIAATGASLLPIIRKLLSTPGMSCITFRFAFADPDFPEIDCAAAHWRQEVRVVTDQLAHMEDEDRKVRFLWTYYRHLPTMHGIMFENEHLLLGFFRWVEKDGRRELSGAERPYLYIRKDDELAGMFFDLFNSWFQRAWKDV